MNKKLRRAILFSTAILALGTIGSTTASVNASFIPANQYVVKNQSKIVKEMTRRNRRDFDSSCEDVDPSATGDYTDANDSRATVGYLLLHPRVSVPVYDHPNQLKNGYRNYLSGTYKIYAKPGSRRHNRVVANMRTVRRLGKNYIPCRVLRRTHNKSYYEVHFKSGLTGWIDDEGVYPFSSYSKMKSYLSASNAYEISPRNERKSLAYYAKFNNKFGRRARAYLRKYRAKVGFGNKVRNKVNRRLMSLINTSAYNVYHNHHHMNRTAKRNLAEATKIINHYRHIRHALKYSPITYNGMIKEAKKGRIATYYDCDGDDKTLGYTVTDSERATLHNIKTVHLTGSPY